MRRIALHAWSTRSAPCSPAPRTNYAHLSPAYVWLSSSCHTTSDLNSGAPHPRYRGTRHLDWRTLADRLDTLEHLEHIEDRSARPAGRGGGAQRGEKSSGSLSVSRAIRACCVGFCATSLRTRAALRGGSPIEASVVPLHRLVPASALPTADLACQSRNASVFCALLPSLPVCVSVVMAEGLGLALVRQIAPSRRRRTVCAAPWRWHLFRGDTPLCPGGWKSDLRSRVLDYRLGNCRAHAQAGAYSKRNLSANSL